MRVLVAVLLLLSGCALNSQPAAEPQELRACTWNPVTQAAYLPSFECLDGSAAPQGLPAPVIINVWGSWCDPCREEIPYLIRLDREHDVSIIGVDVDEPSKAAGQRFARSSGMTWPNLIDTKSESTSLYGPGVPVTWFIGKSGTVVYKKIGVWKSYQELEAAAKKYGMLS